MAQPTLDERFRKGPPAREADESHGWMSSNERRFILWGLKEGWSAARIGRGLGVNEATVRRFRTKFAKDPELIFQLGTYEIYGRAKNDEYRCLVCADQVLGRGEIERHVLRHFLDGSRVDELLPPETPTPKESSPTVEAPRAAAVQDRADESSAVASTDENTDDETDITAASSEAPVQLDDFERLVGQIGADGTLEDVLKRALSEASRRRSQSEHDTRPTSASRIPPETPETDRRESLMLTQLQERRKVRRRESEATEAGDESRQDEGSETSGAFSDDAGQAIPLPSSLRSEVEGHASAPMGSGQSQAPTEDRPDEAGRREGADSHEALTGRREPSEQIGEQDQGPSETEMMRLAFERLKTQTGEQSGGPPFSGRREESPRPAQRGEQTIIDGETAGGRQRETPPERNHQPGEGGVTPSEPDVSSESEIRRAAYDRLRAQAAEQEVISLPSDRSIEEDESARRIRGILGEPVSLPQEGPDDTEKPSPPGEPSAEGRGERSSGPDVAPADAETGRAAFDRLRVQAAEQEEVSPPQSEESDDEDESARRIRGLEGILGEPVSPPQQVPDDTEKPSPPGGPRAEGRGERSTGPDVAPTDAETGRAAFDRLRAQAAVLGGSHLRKVRRATTLTSARGEAGTLRPM